MEKSKNSAGYKKTKVGWIPEDWECGRLRDCSSKIGSGITPRGGSEVYVSNGVPFIRSQNVLDGVFSSDGLKYITDSQHAAMRGSALQRNDILFNITGASIGRCCLLPEQYDEANVNQHVCIVRLRERSHPRLFVNILNSFIAKKQLYENQAGGGREGLNFRNLGGFKIPLPPLPEQIAITGVLECWDKAIRNYKKKIEKKRNIKKGLMQRLLSGKQRLPGFDDKWRSHPFGDVFTFLKTYAFSRAQLTTESSGQSAIYNIHYGDLHATYDSCILDCETEIRLPRLQNTSLVSSDAVCLQDGDLVIADASEDYEGICACIELQNIADKRITGGLHTFVVRDAAGKTAPGYRGYILKEEEVAKEVKRIATGVSVHGVSKTNLAKVELSLPCAEEQAAIAKVLATADTEIAALEGKLSALHDQKRFLLNNMVTGTIRLPQFVGTRKPAGTNGDNE